MAQIQMTITEDGLTYLQSALAKGKTIELTNIEYLDSSGDVLIQFPIRSAAVQSSDSNYSLLHVLGEIQPSNEGSVTQICINAKNEDDVSFIFAQYISDETIYTYTDTPVNIAPAFSLLFNKELEEGIEITVEENNLPMQYATSSDVGIVRIATPSEYHSGTDKVGDASLVLPPSSIYKNNEVELCSPDDSSTLQSQLSLKPAESWFSVRNEEPSDATYQSKLYLASDSTRLNVEGVNKNDPNYVEDSHLILRPYGASLLAGTTHSSSYRESSELYLMSTEASLSVSDDNGLADFKFISQGSYTSLNMNNHTTPDIEYEYKTSDQSQITINNTTIDYQIPNNGEEKEKYPVGSFLCCQIDSKEFFPGDTCIINNNITNVWILNAQLAIARKDIRTDIEGFTFRCLQYQKNSVGLWIRIA